MGTISDLPDEIVCQILAFLTIKEAALTSALSKRWRYLFALRPKLFLSFDYRYYNDTSYRDFADRVLAVSANHSLQDFTLWYGHPLIDKARINRWICNLLSRGVLSLDLYVTICQDMYSLPLEIFSCKTIVNLKLGRFFDINMIPENASLPALKTLSLNYVEFHNTFGALISACPVLEELTVQGYPCDPQTVSCPTLKRLTLSYKSKSFRYRRRSFTFDTRNLAYFGYEGFTADGYPFVNFHSLVEAKVSLYLTGSLSTHNPMKLFQGLKNVEILSLSDHKTSEVFYFFAELIPLFINLSRLSIATGFRDWCSSWKLLPLLIKKSPNLQTLIIKGPLHFDYYAEPLSCQCLSEFSFLSSCPVKVLEITEYSGTKGELEHMKHFLEKLPCLELVKIRTSADADFIFTSDLVLLTEACKIQLKVFSCKN